MGISILVWSGILMSSFRGGGDHWDNPRYRVSWIGLQAALAGWVWIAQRKGNSPWLRRILVGMGLMLIWWVPWYLIGMVLISIILGKVFTKSRVLAEVPRAQVNS